MSAKIEKKIAGNSRKFDFAHISVLGRPISEKIHDIFHFSKYRIISEKYEKN